jgi:hypothetical protein
MNLPYWLSIVMKEAGLSLHLGVWPRAPPPSRAGVFECNPKSKIKNPKCRVHPLRLLECLG